MSRKEFSKEYSGDLSQLRKIIASFNLIQNAPSDEFDSLIHKILRQLEKGADQEKLNKILHSELVISYGLYNTEFDATRIVEKIINWWNIKA